jgi:hypothetical protein
MCAASLAMCAASLAGCGKSRVCACFWVAQRRGPQHARFWRDGVERCTAAIAGLFSAPALAAEGGRRKAGQLAIEPLIRLSLAWCGSEPRMVPASLTRVIRREPSTVSSGRAMLSLKYSGAELT